jgi:hypothetical protein
MGREDLYWEEMCSWRLSLYSFTTNMTYMSALAIKVSGSAAAPRAAELLVRDNEKLNPQSTRARDACVERECWEHAGISSSCELNGLVSCINIVASTAPLYKRCNRSASWMMPAVGGNYVA